MNKQEFLDTLRRALVRELTEAEVEENIRFYNQYIEDQIQSGKTEDQVLSMLGDPRLIARTILQVDEQKEEQGRKSNVAETVYEDGDRAYEEQSWERTQSYGGYQDYTNPEADVFGSGRSPFGFHVYGIKKWQAILALIIILAIVFVILGTAFAILWKLLPFLLVAGVVLTIYHKLFG